MAVDQNLELVFELLEHSVAKAVDDSEQQVVLQEGLPTEVRAFIDPATSRRGLVVYLDEDQFDGLKPVSPSQNFGISKLRSEGKPSVRITLFNAEFRKVFYVFCSEYLRELSTSSLAPSTLAVRMYERWKKFFQGKKNDQNQMTDSQQIGLICELEVLLALCQSGVQNASQFWMGSGRQPHDFQLEDRSLECKGTTRTNGLYVEIHGSFNQLQPLPRKGLELVVGKYRQDPHGDVSVPKLVSALLSEDSIDQFDLTEKLLECGYNLDDADAHQGMKSYIRLAAYEFEVTPNFPHLIEQGVKDRIESVNYTLNLSNPETLEGFKTENDYLR